MRTLRIFTFGLGLLAATRGLAGMNYHCAVSDPEYAHIAESFTVHESRDLATLDFGNLKPLHDIVVYASADAGAPSPGQIHGNLQPKMMSPLAQHNSATVLRMNIGTLLSGVVLMDQTFILEISRPVAVFGSFDASATIWEEFADGRRVMAEFKDGDRIRSLESPVSCESF